MRSSEVSSVMEERRRLKTGLSVLVIQCGGSWSRVRNEARMTIVVEKMVVWEFGV